MNQVRSTTVRPDQSKLPTWFWSAAAIAVLIVLAVASTVAISATRADLSGAQLAAAPLAATGTGSASPSSALVTPHACANCGVVASVVAHRVRGKASGVGAVAGGVLGGVVGNQFGRGSGNVAMTLLGAVGGGLAGAQVEKNIKAHTVYDTKVRMSDGTLRLFHLKQAFGVGARVKVVKGSLHAA